MSDHPKGDYGHPILGFLLLCAITAAVIIGVYAFTGVALDPGPTCGQSGQCAP